MIDASVVRPPASTSTSSATADLESLRRHQKRYCCDLHLPAQTLSGFSRRRLSRSSPASQLRAQLKGMADYSAFRDGSCAHRSAPTTRKRRPPRKHAAAGRALRGEAASASPFGHRREAQARWRSRARRAVGRRRIAAVALKVQSPTSCPDEAGASRSKGHAMRSCHLGQMVASARRTRQGAHSGVIVPEGRRGGRSSSASSAIRPSVPFCSLVSVGGTWRCSKTWPWRPCRSAKPKRAPCSPASRAPLSSMPIAANRQPTSPPSSP